MRNESGINPTEFKVVILPKDDGKFHKFTGKDGKTYQLEKPDDSADREKFAQMEGILVAVSPHAFSYAEWNGSKKPEPGDRVLYAKYAGTTWPGKDGKDYRIVNDKDLWAVLS